MSATSNLNDNTCIYVHDKWIYLSDLDFGLCLHEMLVLYGYLCLLMCRIFTQGAYLVEATWLLIEVSV